MTRIRVDSARVIGGKRYGFVYGGKQPTAVGIAMRIRASGGLARVIRTGGKHEEAWICIANDRGRPRARAMIESLMDSAA